MVGMGCRGWGRGDGGGGDRVGRSATTCLHLVIYCTVCTKYALSLSCKRVGLYHLLL